MKYLFLVVVGLLLSVTDLPNPPRDAASPSSPLNTSASFATTEAGTTAEVGIDVADPSAPSWVSIFITGHRSGCVGEACQLDLSVVQTVDPLEASIDRQRREGYVHGRFHLRDAKTLAALVVRVDVEWAGRGPVSCVPLDEGAACTRVATVWAAVASGGEVFVSSQVRADGQFLWHAPIG